MNKAAKKRQEEIAEAVAVSTQRKNAADRLLAVPDDALFVQDKKGSKKAAVKEGARAGKAAPGAAGQKGRAASPAPAAAAVAVAAVAPAAAAPSAGAKKAVAAAAPPAPEVYDLWGEEPAGKQPRRRHFALPPPPSVVRIPKVPLPAPGISYNPSYEDHQDAIGVAVASELARDYAAEVARDKSMRVRVTAASSEVEGVVTAGAGAPSGTPSSQAKPQDRLTRAQRHKRERHDKEVEAALQRKAQKRFMVDVERAKSIAKEIREEERRHAEELKARAQLTAEKERERVEELLRPSLLDVPLSEELKGTLRQMKVTNSAFKDRFDNIVMRKMATPVLHGERKKKKVRILRDK